MGFLDNKSYFDGDKPLIIPHRGGSNLVPENTLHGLELAIREGFSHFETDLRMSKDGEIFLHHDETFDRTTNVSGKVQDFNWSEISKINAGYKFYEKTNQKGKKTIETKGAPQFVLAQEVGDILTDISNLTTCLLYTSPSPRD